MVALRVWLTTESSRRRNSGSPMTAERNATKYEPTWKRSSERFVRPGPLRSLAKTRRSSARIPSVTSTTRNGRPSRSRSVRLNTSYVAWRPHQSPGVRSIFAKTRSNGCTR